MRARCCMLALTLIPDNYFGDEGAKCLSEPLGKLTALQRLDLGGGDKLILFWFARGFVSIVGSCAHVRCCDLFLTRIPVNNFKSQAASFLSKPLGKLTALQHLDLHGIILILF